MAPAGQAGQQISKHWLQKQSRSGTLDSTLGARALRYSSCYAFVLQSCENTVLFIEKACLSVCMQRSRCHDDVLRKLIGMGIACSCEDVSTGLELDIAIPYLRIAIEIDGPTHFARNVPRPLGATALKQRHLEAMGWALLSVRNEVWDNPASQKVQLQELRELMLERRRLLGN